MKEIVWSKKEGTCETYYFSDSRYEFIIAKEDNFWILRYTDFWTLHPSSFFVNIKKQDSYCAVKELKDYAQKIVDSELYKKIHD